MMKSEDLGLVIALINKKLTASETKSVADLVELADLMNTEGYVGQIVYVESENQYYQFYDDGTRMKYRVYDKSTHVHANLTDVLDKLSVDAQGRLLFDGNLVGQTSEVTDELNRINEELVTINDTLDDKADLIHTHAIADITNLLDTLNGIATDISDINTELDNKAELTHTHAMADVTDLENTIDKIKLELQTLSKTMELKGEVANYTELLAIPTPEVGDVYIVQNSETIADVEYKKGQYCYTETGWFYLSDVEIEMRDFTVDRIDLTTEVKNKLPEANIDDAIARKTDLHEHLNKDQLDKIGEDVLGNLTYNGNLPKPDMTDIYSKTEVDTILEDYALDTDLHTHDNKAVIDELSERADGKLLYKNEVISGEDYQLPIASSTELGGIKVGSSLSINPTTGELDVIGTTPVDIPSDLTFNETTNLLQLKDEFGAMGEGVVLPKSVSKWSEVTDKPFDKLDLNKFEVLLDGTDNVLTTKTLFVTGEEYEALEASGTVKEGYIYIIDDGATESDLQQLLGTKAELIHNHEQVEVIGLETELNNINTKIQSLVSSMKFVGEVADLTELNAISNPTNGDVYKVDSENATFVYTTTGWMKLSSTDITVRDFTTQPIDLATEVTGILPTSRLNSSEVALKTDLHSHTNKSVVDKLGENVDGDLTYNGELITTDLSNYYNKQEVYNKDEVYTQEETNTAIDNALEGLNTLTGQPEYLNAGLLSAVDGITDGMTVPFEMISGNIAITNGEVKLKKGKTYMINCGLSVSFSEDTGIVHYNIFDSEGSRYNVSNGYTLPPTSLSKNTTDNIISCVITPTKDVLIHVEIKCVTISDVRGLDNGGTYLIITEIPTPQAIIDVSDTHINDVANAERSLKTYTDVTQLGLTTPTTVGQIFNALPTNSYFIYRTNMESVTDVPITSVGVLTIEKSIVNTHRIMFNHSASGSVGNVNYTYMGQLKGTDGTGLVWKKVVFADVNDVAKTTIDLATLYPNNFNANSVLYYSVKNGICYITGANVNFKVTGAISISTLPTADVYTVAFLNSADNVFSGTMSTSTTGIKFTGKATGVDGLGSMSYPVAP